MIGLDTNVLVRYLTRDDRAQFDRACEAILGLDARGDSARLDALVLCELSWVLESAYGFDRARVADTLAALLDAGTFEIEDRDLVRTAIERSRAPGGDFSDHLIGLRNRRAGCDKSLTFDRALRRSPDFELL